MTSSQIQAIRERYQASLPEKAELITSQIDALSNSTKDAFSEAHSVLHKLAGSSGMYGYSDIALICRSAMESAQNQDLSSLLQQLSELKELLEQHSS